MLLTALCGAVYGVLAKPFLRRYAATTLTAYAMLVGTVVLVPAALVEGLPGALAEIDRETGLLVLYLGVLGGAVGYWLITYALARLTPSQTAAYINVNPLVAVLLGAALLDEALTVGFAVGFALVAAGLLLANWPVPTARRHPEAIVSGRAEEDEPA